ncbi:hypothetical protein [Niabella ginsenosidivorans]|uniref:hypothetical protein n=1 Tax=Niabella ginsenosidivorans TaxID=1176587 RepID=UPI001FE1F21D|nr:hypothetical protein [Niabella ginsenosidivorans]
MKPAAGPGASKLIIEEPEPRPVTVPQSPVAPAPAKKISSLEKLRKQFKETHVEQVDHPLTREALTAAWEEFIVHLKQNKNSAAQSFSLAQLKVLDDNSFYVYTANAIEYRFVESCKTEASEFLQKKLSNSQLQFYIIKRENKEAAETDEPKPLTAVQQYQKMIEKYPLVKELKEKLKMELDR